MKISANAKNARIMKTKQEILKQYDWESSDYIHRAKSRYAPKIGHFLIQFSALEYTLDIATVEHISDRLHHLGYLVLEGNSLYDKIELFRKLSHVLAMHTRPRQLKKLSTLIKRLHEVRTFRNYLSHANWSTLEATGYVRTKVLEKEGEVIFRKIRITPDVIDAWTRRVERLHSQLDAFVETQYNF